MALRPLRVTIVSTEYQQTKVKLTQVDERDLVEFVASFSPVVDVDLALTVRHGNLSQLTQCEVQWERGHNVSGVDK